MIRAVGLADPKENAHEMWHKVHNLCRIKTINFRHVGPGILTRSLVKNYVAINLTFELTLHWQPR